MIVEICGIIISHPFYFYDECDTFLHGFDIVSSAALIIDAPNCCVYSKYTDVIQLVINCLHTPTGHTESNFQREVPSYFSDSSYSDSRSLPRGIRPAPGQMLLPVGLPCTLTAEGEHPLQIPAETGFSASDTLLTSRPDAFDFDVTELKSRHLCAHTFDPHPRPDPSRAVKMCRALH